MSVQDNVKKIGQKLRELRKQKGFSQREVAAGVCSESAVSQIENGTYPSMPSATLLQGICDKLGVTLGNLLSEVHVDRESMENDVLIDIVKVLIHRGEYDHALLMIKEVQGRDSLLKYQRIEIGISLGDCFLKMGDFKQSIQVLTDLQQEVEADRETDDRVLATLHNKLGNAWYFASDMINAHNYYKRAFQASQRFPQSDQLSALILYNLGHVCMWLRIDHEAQTYLEQAVVLFEQFSDYKDLADALYVLGVLYKNMGDFMNAGIFIKKSLALFESLEVRDWALLAKHQYAFYILAEEDPREAISELLRTVSEYQQLGEIQKIPYLRARISFLYLGLGEVYKAKSFIESAISEVQEGGTQIELMRAYVYRVYSKYLLEVKEYEKSIEYSFKSADILDKIKLDKEIADSLVLAVDAYTHMGDSTKALEVSKRVIQVLRNQLSHVAIPK